MTRVPLTHAERSSATTVGAITATFLVYGRITGAPSTVAYALTVGALTVGLIVLRREPLPSDLLIALPVLTAAHLAGGLVRVGGDVLYNTRLGSPVLQYDHIVHASGVLVGTVVLYRLFGRASGADHVVVLLLAGLGIGALNEMIEFLTTLAHNGAHVGGYENTGWDLVANLVGALVAGVVLRSDTALAR